jgi:DNA-binding MarR family transcriptional regulator
VVRAIRAEMSRRRLRQRPHPTDSRLVQISLTPAGQAYLVRLGIIEKA